jgi:hypothetical protein
MDEPRSSTPRPNRPKLRSTSDGVVRGNCQLKRKFFEHANGIVL